MRINFLVISSWSWDHHNQQLATFTIEDYSNNFKNLHDRQVDEWFPDFLKTYKLDILDYVKKIIEAQDGSTQGKANPFALYFIKKMNGAEIAQNFTMTMELAFICKIDNEFKLIFSS